MVAAFGDERAFPGMGGARMSAAEALMASQPELGLKVLEDWNVRHYIPRMNAVSEWAKNDPRGTAEKVAAINADFAGIEALGAVGKAWAQADPQAALEFAIGLSGKKQAKFASSAMHVWAENDLEGAIEFASEQEDVGFRGLIGSGLLAVWGTHDPAAALAWGQENLQSQLRSEAIGSLVESLTKKDPQEAAELVGGMSTSGAQFLAAERLLATWVRESDGRAIGEAIEWVGSLPDHDLAQSALNSASWYFTMEDPQAFISVIEGDHPHLIGGRVLSEAVSEQVRRSPLGAIDWARNLPEDRAARVGRMVVNSWIDVQPAAASDWSIGLPAGEQRTDAIDQIARSFSHRAPDQLRPWYERLNPDERTRVREIVTGFSTSDERRAAFAEAVAE